MNVEVPLAIWMHVRHAFSLMWTILSYPFVNFFQLVDLVFPDISNDDVSFVQILQRARFAFTFYLFHSLRSRFRDIRAIRVKYFAVPICVVWLGGLLSRSLVPPLVVLTVLWWIAALMMYITDQIRLATVRLRAQVAPRNPAPADMVLHFYFKFVFLEFIICIQWLSFCMCLITLDKNRDRQPERQAL